MIQLNYPPSKTHCDARFLAISHASAAHVYLG